MNRNLKLIVVAVISFLLGVTATIIYELPSKNGRDRELVAKINSEKSNVMERKSFFVKANEVIPKVVQNFSKSEGSAAQALQSLHR